MKLKIQARQTGKSYDIAQIMKVNKKAVCFQPNVMMKERFCENFQINKKRVFIPHDLLIEKKLPKNCEVYIDELEGFLDFLIKKPIKDCTYTGEVFFTTINLQEIKGVWKNGK